MRTLFQLFLLTLSTALLAHPGGGIIALSEDSAIVADPVENFIWLVKKGEAPKQLVSKFHGHWMTRGLDGHIYAEAFQEWGGAWSSAAFRLDLPTAKLTEVAHRDDLGVLEFVVDRDGALVFQRGESLVSRKNGKESPFRPLSNQRKLEHVTSYAWGREGDLVLADRNRILRVDAQGNISLLSEIQGKVLEPKIWNATDTPSVFGLAIDPAGHVLATVPDLAKVFRIEPNQKPQEIALSEDGWRATGVAVHGNSILLMESDPRASTSPRVRILRSNGTTELLTLPSGRQ